MFRRFFGKASGLVLLGQLAACSAADVSLDSASAPKGASQSGHNAAEPSIEFVDSDLQFFPGDVRRITATVAPAAIYDVRFSLAGDFGDAFLDESQVQSDTDGSASVSLSAPSSAATFTVRASAGQATATLPVSVGAGFSDLRVDVGYAGRRTVTTWVASVRAGSSCRALPGIPAEDGPLVAESAATESPVVTGIPVGVPLTVTVRAGHFAGGCTEFDGAVAGASVNSVDVTVLDRPLQMDGVSLTVDLGVDQSADVDAVWKCVAGELAACFVDHAANDATALLDSMLDEIPASPPESREAFKAARALHAWDTTLMHSLHDGFGVDGLHGLVSTWIQSSLEGLSKPAVTGTLTSRTSSGFGLFQLSAFGGFEPSNVGLSTSDPTSAFAVTWTAASNDQVLFGGTPKWPLSRLATILAEGVARDRVKNADTLPKALASVLSCTDVATLLVPDTTNGAAYVDCDGACIATLCEGALERMWTRAAYTPEDPTLLDFAATAATTVSDDAHPSAFDGTWIGSVQIGDSVAKLHGSATGR